LRRAGPKRAPTLRQGDSAAARVRPARTAVEWRRLSSPAPRIPPMPCTTLLVGRNASAAGSPLVARTEDSSAGSFAPQRVVVVRPQDQPRTYTSVIGRRTIELPEEPLRYTSLPNALPDEGIWGCAGINAANVAMSATETITSNPRVLGADPL